MTTNDTNNNTRPSTATTYHARADSAESQTVTLFSSRSSTSSITVSPPRQMKTKAKRVPAPLVLAKDVGIEAALRSGRELKPPVSPNVNLLKGMERSARDVGNVKGENMHMAMHSPGAVGVAF